MNDWQRMVTEFHDRFGVEIGKSPALRKAAFRAALIAEEAGETCEALLRGDFVESIDGLCDIIYVVLGTAVTLGIDLELFMAEVHASNMAKIGGPTRPDGKILKPDGWQPPRIRELLEKVIANNTYGKIGE